MTADLNTELVVRGTNSEIAAVLRVIRAYAMKNGDIYLDSADLKTNMHKEDLRFLSDEQFEEILAEVEGSVKIRASGPYGRFGWIEDISLFEDLANAAPTVEFEGSIHGFASDVKQGANAELRNGILRIEYDYYFEEESEDCEDLTFVISGKLKHFDNREDFIAYIEDYGGIVSSNISSKTNFLISNDKDETSAKIKRQKIWGSLSLRKKSLINDLLTQTILMI